MHFDIRRGIVAPRGPSTKDAPFGTLTAKMIAMMGDDYPNVVFDLHIKEGDTVRAGQTLCVDRHRPEICFVANASGRVSKIRLGPRRRLELLEIAVGGDGSVTFDTDDLSKLLLKSGAWTSFRTRPFGLIPDPTATPAAIFVTATNATPQAPDPLRVIAAKAENFERGAKALLQLTTGPVFVCQRKGASLLTPYDRLKIATFSGPFPSGNAGPQIHRLLPVSRQRKVWEIGYQDVMAIGHLLATGQIKTSRVVSVSGTTHTKVVVAPLGIKLADVAQTIDHFDGDQLRSGSRLTGRKSHYLSRRDLQISTGKTEALPRPFWHRVFDALPVVSMGATLPMEAFERAFPFDILPTPLMRALAIGDVEAAERLGCLELVEEDMAVLTQLCTSGYDYGHLLRHSLNLLLRERAG
ncbi:MAG: hypothetical protein WBK15_05365 [Yoonia sp.]